MATERAPVTPARAPDVNEYPPPNTSTGGKEHPPSRSRTVKNRRDHRVSTEYWNRWLRIPRWVLRQLRSMRCGVRPTAAPQESLSNCLRPQIRGRRKDQNAHCFDTPSTLLALLGPRSMLPVVVVGRLTLLGTRPFKIFFTMWSLSQLFNGRSSTLKCITDNCPPPVKRRLLLSVVLKTCMSNFMISC